jgi:hypothetical protein
MSIKPITGRGGDSLRAKDPLASCGRQGAEQSAIVEADGREGIGRRKFRREKLQKETASRRIFFLMALTELCSRVPLCSLNPRRSIG